MVAQTVRLTVVAFTYRWVVSPTSTLQQQSTDSSRVRVRLVDSPVAGPQGRMCAPAAQDLQRLRRQKGTGVFLPGSTRRGKSAVAATTAIARTSSVDSESSLSSDMSTSSNFCPTASSPEAFIEPQSWSPFGGRTFDLRLVPSPVQEAVNPPSWGAGQC